MLCDTRHIKYKKYLLAVVLYSPAFDASYKAEVPVIVGSKKISPENTNGTGMSVFPIPKTKLDVTYVKLMWFQILKYVSTSLKFVPFF